MFTTNQIKEMLNFPQIILFRSLLHQILKADNFNYLLMGNICPSRAGLKSAFFEQSWAEIAEEYHLNLEYGICLPENYEYPTSFKTWEEICLQLPKLNSQKASREVIRALPLVDTSRISNYNDLIVAYSMLSYLMLSFVWSDDPPAQRLPSNIAIPFFDVITKLGISRTPKYCVQYWNWQRKDQSLPPDYDNLCSKYKYTDVVDEQEFFMSGIQGTIIFNVIFQQIHAANQAINQNEEKKFIQACEAIIQLFKQIQANIKQIYTKVRIESLDVFGKWFSGFHEKDLFPNGLYFEGVGECSEDTGGAVGSDPGFQVFEGAFGIEYTGVLQCVQKIFRDAMTNVQRNLIEDFKKHSLIRQYVLRSKSLAVKQAYNSAIQAYAKVLSSHKYIMINYIEKPKAKKAKAIEGHSAIQVSDIQDRYLVAEKFKVI